MIRIVIAEGQEILLGVIGSLLNLEDDMEVVGQAGDGEEAIKLVHKLQPDVCIMDIEMPKMSGLEAAEELKQFGCKVMLLTTFARAGYGERAIEADVRGYLIKDAPSEELACAVRRIMEGEQIYSPELMDEASGHSKEELSEQLGHYPTPHQTVEPKNNTSSMVRHYISTILEKMKQPAG